MVLLGISYKNHHFFNDFGTPIPTIMEHFFKPGFLVLLVFVALSQATFHRGYYVGYRYVNKAQEKSDVGSRICQVVAMGTQSECKQLCQDFSENECLRRARYRIFRFKLKRHLFNACVQSFCSDLPGISMTFTHKIKLQGNN